MKQVDRELEKEEVGFKGSHPSALPVLVVRAPFPRWND